MMKSPSVAATANCHCGAVSIEFSAAPTEVTDCNCSLCRKLGVLWAYCDKTQIAISPDPSPTDTYAWNGHHVDFHRCRNCGCITHWVPRDPARDMRGINARLLHAEILASAKVRHLDGAVTQEYLD
jgi:hypothetical protein